MERDWSDRVRNASTNERPDRCANNHGTNIAGSNEGTDCSTHDVTVSISATDACRGSAIAVERCGFNPPSIALYSASRRLAGVLCGNHPRWWYDRVDRLDTRTTPRAETVADTRIALERILAL
jgi:hypothetical protein